MALPTATSLIDYTGNGATTAYPVPFRFLANSHLKVYVDDADEETPLVEGVDYTVSGAAADVGGTVAFAVAPTNAAAIRIRRVVPLVQAVNLRTQGDFSPETHEAVFDYLTMGLQQLNDGLASQLTGFEFGSTDVNSALVLSTGSSTTRTLAARFAEETNVKDFGATGDGSTDDSTAVLAALAYAKAHGHGLFFPAGTYKVSSTLAIADVYGMTVRGLSRDKSAITWAGGNVPMIKITNSQHVTVQSLRFVGNVSGASRPSACIESVSDTTYGRTYVPTANIFRDLLIGTGAANEFTYGIKYTHTGTASDTNNSEGSFQAVVVQGVVEACILFAHAQSKCHHFYDCGFVGGKCGVRTNPSGAFAWHSGNISNMSETCFDLGATNDYILISGLTSEGCARLMTVGPSGGGWAISILASRFDSSDIHADGRAIVLGCRGPLIVRGVEFDGAMTIATNWQTVPGGVLEISGCNFNWTNSANASVLEHLGYGGDCSLYSNTYADGSGAAYGVRPDNEALTFNVRRYGATGNGIIDDTAAIQACLDAAKAFGGGVVFMPKGIYRITDRLTVGTRCVDEDDIYFATGYNYTMGASFDSGALSTARSNPFIDIIGEGSSTTTLWCDWTSTTGKAAIFYGVSTSEGKVNTYNGRVADFAIIGKEGMTGMSAPSTPPSLASIDGADAMPVGNHQVGIAAVLASVKVERVYFRQLAQGLLMSDCYLSRVDDCQALHCGNGFVFLKANAGHGRNLLASSCRGIGFTVTGQQFHYSGFHTENCAVSIYITACDNGKVSDCYIESTYVADTDWQVKIGDSANAAQNQVIAFSLHDVHLYSQHGKAIRFHSCTYAVLMNVRSYTTGSLLNNQYVQLLIIGYPLDIDLATSNATALARLARLGPGIPAVKVTGLSTGERDALTLEKGVLIYNTSTDKLNFCNGAAWEVITSA